MRTGITRNARPVAWLLAAVLLPGCDCGSSGAPDPCAGIDCGEFGDCRVAPDGSTPYCACDPGYRPDGTAGGCVPVDPDDPCSGVECSGHGGCRVAIDGTTPYCTCDPGWVVDETRLHCLPEPATPPDAGDDGTRLDDAAAVDDRGTVPDGGDGAVVVPPPRVVPLAGPAINRVDILLVVDDSASMGEEQAVLARRLPDMIGELLSPPDRDGDGSPDHPAVQDLRLGVTSTDMGTQWVDDFSPTCRDEAHSNGGCLLHAPNPLDPACASSYPAWLARDPTNADTYSPERFVADAACIAAIGTRGCEFEQPFLAATRAIIEQTLPGRCNAGFLRADSLLMLLFVSDDDDCSVTPDHPEMFDPTMDATLGPLETRCFRNPGFVHHVTWIRDRIVEARGGRKEDIVLGMIVGVPPGEPRCTGYGDELSSCLAVPAMVERPDRDGRRLVPSCSTSMGDAMPAVRFVELAQAWGRNAYVSSICSEDWANPLGMIGARMAERLAPDRSCLVAAIPYDYARCRTPCRLVMTLPDDGPCAEDPDCPSAGCPPVTSTDVLTAPPCTHPTTGASCVPRERDFGTTGDDGTGSRLCVLRQAERTIGADGRCGAVTVSGWRYIIPSASAYGCHELDLIDPDTGRSMIRAPAALWCPR